MASGAERAGDDAPGVRWALGVLLGAAVDAVTVTIGRRPPAGHRVVWSFVPLPSASHAYALVPLGAPAAAAAAVRGLGNPLARRQRWVEAAASTAIRTGIPQRAIEPVHLSVPVGSGVVETDIGVFGRLLQVFERTDLAFAVILGRDRPNRKPVVKVVRPDGIVLGFAKVGWNDLSRALVRDEGAALARVLAAGPSTFSVPAPILSERLADVELLVVEPLPQAGWRGQGPPLELPVAATREVAALEAMRREPMRSGAYGSGLRSRVEEGTYLRTELSDALDRIDAAWDDAPIAVGPWHGDWIPWNMQRVDGRLFVWDWERAAPGVPVGLDAMHFAFEVALKVHGMPAEDAARRATGSVTARAGELGAEPETARALMAYHLIEMGLRFRAGAEAGIEVRHDAYVRALVAAVGGAP